MLSKEYFKDKKISIIGLGRSGQASAIMLNSLGAEVSIGDIDNTCQLKEIAKNLEKMGIAVELGDHTEKAIAGSELVIVSPGVPNDSKALTLARSFNIPIISEIELGYRLCPSPIVAVTGTNGKTTVTTLIGEILKKKFKRVFILGNIGTPFCSKVLELTKSDMVVLEVSSFQLEYIDEFRPKAAVFLNFTTDHLNRHKSLEEYLSAKRRIFKNQQGNDYAVLNSDDKIAKSLAPLTKAQVLYFGNSLNGKIKSVKLNPNFLAALVVGEIFKIDREEVLSIFRDFRGVEHRLEFIRSMNGVEFLNDSKATNIDSTIWAFNNISKPIILIAGGRDKGSDFRSVRDMVRKKVKLLISLGEAKHKILDAFSDCLPTKEARDLQEAVMIAKDNASAGDCVLLSPMCASFDMFNNYEERGRIFKDLVNKL